MDETAAISWGMISQDRTNRDKDADRSIRQQKKKVSGVPGTKACKDEHITLLRQRKRGFQKGANFSPGKLTCHHRTALRGRCSAADEHIGCSARSVDRSGAL